MHGFNYSIPHFITRVRGTRIVVTLNFISKVLHILKVEFDDYLGREHLRTMSKDELSSCFVRHLYLGVIVKRPLA